MVVKVQKNPTQIPSCYFSFAKKSCADLYMQGCMRVVIIGRGAELVM